MELSDGLFQAEDSRTQLVCGRTFEATGELEKSEYGEGLEIGSLFSSNAIRYFWTRVGSF